MCKRQKIGGTVGGAWIITSLVPTWDGSSWRENHCSGSVLENQALKEKRRRLMSWGSPYQFLPSGTTQQPSRCAPAVFPLLSCPCWVILHDTDVFMCWGGSPWPIPVTLGLKDYWSYLNLYFHANCFPNKLPKAKLITSLLFKTFGKLFTPFEVFILALSTSTLLSSHVFCSHPQGTSAVWAKLGYLKCRNVQVLMGNSVSFFNC